MANTTFSGPVTSENGFVGSLTGSVAATTVSATGNITADSGTAPTAGGMLAFAMSSTSGLGIYVGSGAPTISAAQGSIYLRTDGSSTSTRLYVNTTGSTTWTNVTTAA
jgi:hypothetical protein